MARETERLERLEVIVREIAYSGRVISPEYARSILELDEDETEEPEGTGEGSAIDFTCDEEGCGRAFDTQRGIDQHQRATGHEGFTQNRDQSNTND